MGGVEFGLYLASTFCGGIVTGIAGFAFGLIVTGLWLHLLTPVETAGLIACYGLTIQTFGVWKLRRSIDLRAVAPYIAGGIIGAPIGVRLLTILDPQSMRWIVGGLLVAYGLYGFYGFVRPATSHLRSNALIDGGIGVANGMLAGMTGLPGIIITIWCAMRGLTKDEQRSVYQPVLLGTTLVTVSSLVASGSFPLEVLKYYAFGLPPLFAGMWIGYKLYGRLDDVGFRRIILVLLILSGLVLTVPDLIAWR